MLYSFLDITFFIKLQLECKCRSTHRQTLFYLSITLTMEIDVTLIHIKTKQIHKI